MQAADPLAVAGRVRARRTRATVRAAPRTAEFTARHVALRRQSRNPPRARECTAASSPIPGRAAPYPGTCRADEPELLMWTSLHAGGRRSCTPCASAPSTTRPATFVGRSPWIRKALRPAWARHATGCRRPAGIRREMLENRQARGDSLRLERAPARIVLQLQFSCGRWWRRSTSSRRRCCPATSTSSCRCRPRAAGRALVAGGAERASGA